MAISVKIPFSRIWHLPEKSPCAKVSNSALYIAILPDSKTVNANHSRKGLKSHCPFPTITHYVNPAYLEVKEIKKEGVLL